MKLTVVIPTCDRPDALRACLEKLQPANQTYVGFPCEVVVSDDSRKVAAQTLLGREFPHVKWINGPHRGPAAHRNAGAAAAQGDVVVFLDDDCLPQPELVAAYAGAFADPSLLAAEGRIRADRPHRRMNEEAPVNESGGCFWSCNIAIRRNFFLEIGGFDERFPYAAMEDVELRERIIRTGTSIRFLPHALVIHPLRIMPGWGYLRKRAASHGIYILMPSCHLGRPSYSAALRHTLRLIVRRFIPRFIALRGRGAWSASRTLTLPLWSAWYMKKALRTRRRTAKSGYA